MKFAMRIATSNKREKRPINGAHLGARKTARDSKLKNKTFFFKKMSLLKESQLFGSDSLCYYHGIQALAARKKTSAAKKLCTAGVRQRLSNEFSELFLQKVAKWTLRLGAFAFFFFDFCSDGFFFVILGI